MLKVRNCLVLLLIGCSSVLAQQASQTAPAPDPPRIEKTVPVTPPAQQKKDELEACPATFNYSLETNGVTPSGKGSGVTPPRITYLLKAKVTSEAENALRGKDEDAVSVFSLVVDVNGKPTEICLNKEAGYGLDQEAHIAVKQYRFIPAKKDKKPIVARMVVALSVRLY